MFYIRYTNLCGNPKSKVFYYLIDTRGGQSGSGAYAYWPSTGKRVIYGVHTSWSGLPEILQRIQNGIEQHVFVHRCSVYSVIL